jgi:S1-C subfamily serine protease
MKKIFSLFMLCTTLIWPKFDLEVTTTQKGNTYLLENNDIVFSGDTLKFKFHSTYAGTLQIFDDQHSKPFFTKKILKNKTYFFPKEGQELKLDQQSGIEKFIFVLNEKTVKTFTLKHLNRNIPNTKKQKPHKTKLPIVYFPVFDVGEYTDLSKVISNTRDATDKKIFKELSSSTVIIKAGEQLGAGVVIDSEGRLLTNWHLVQNNPLAYIAFKPRKGSRPSRNNYYAAKVVKTDLQKDLALLQLLNNEVVNDKKIKPVTAAEMKKVEVGEDVYTIGHPAGYYYSLSNGIIGNILNNHSWKAKGIHHKADYVIKTQNQISGGNSGGPLVNKELELLGLITYSDTQGQNLNFAVSIEDIKTFLETDSTKRSAKGKKSLTALQSQYQQPQQQETAYRTMRKDVVKSDITYAVDTKGNPVIIKRLDTNNNGIYDIILIDSDNDDKWDKIGYDRNEDGIIEKWSSY